MDVQVTTSGQPQTGPESGQPDPGVHSSTEQLLSGAQSGAQVGGSAEQAASPNWETQYRTLEQRFGQTGSELNELRQKAEAYEQFIISDDDVYRRYTNADKNPLSGSQNESFAGESQRAAPPASQEADEASLARQVIDEGLSNPEGATKALLQFAARIKDDVYKRASLEYQPFLQRSEQDRVNQAWHVQAERIKGALGKNIHDHAEVSKLRAAAAQINHRLGVDVNSLVDPELLVNQVYLNDLTQARFEAGRKSALESEGVRRGQVSQSGTDQPTLGSPNFSTSGLAFSDNIADHWAAAEQTAGL